MEIKRHHAKYCGQKNPTYISHGRRREYYCLRASYQAVEMGLRFFSKVLIAQSGISFSNNAKDLTLIKITEFYVREHIPGSELAPTVLTSNRVSVV